MTQKIEEAIKTLTEKAADNDAKAIDAQQYAQAVLNLSNALVGINSINK